MFKELKINIFYLDSDAKVCAEMHLDKHCVKMILEYAQLLSTAHRVLDGIEAQVLSASGRKQKVWRLKDKSYDSLLYKATHMNHPSAVWARSSQPNYAWLYKLLHCLCKEYTYRYGKVHKVESSGLLHKLSLVPIALEMKCYRAFTEPTPAMPDEYKVSGDSVQSYRNYYVGAKAGFAKWKARSTPEWFTAMLHTSEPINEGVNYASVRL